ncbi:unnamed protein product [Lepeophtheirus salmonis]|uniref:(salmon louse) hypothetical protein n=1 Tax=Lepeophtheirus salmonis TaxID=72036 RepID=A0A7R8D5J1_LEPSM|nr:unnamed protein product [Lepeophtheirus salmonis]CAF3006647.1 unnamed protein product [Lepeophtheirus salmonis]
MYSDEVKNLVGAHKEIKKICDNWSESIKNKTVRNKDLEWKWNCPLASHMNVAVESLIKSIRKASNGIMDYKSVMLTPDEWSTILYKITYMVNSRPLFPINSTNPSDKADFITPNSLLYGEGIIVDQLDEAESS